MSGKLPKNHRCSLAGGQWGVGMLVKIFPSWVLLTKGRGHGLEIGSATAGIALEHCKFLKIKYPKCLFFGISHYVFTFDFCQPHYF